MDQDGIEVTSYRRERHRGDGEAAAAAGAAGLAGLSGHAGLTGPDLIDLYARRQLAVSRLLRGIETSGRQRPHGGRPLAHAADPPLAAIAVDTPPNIEAVLAETAPGQTAPAGTAPAGTALPAGGWLVATARVRLLTGEIEPVWLGEGPGEATMATLYCGNQDHVYQVPAFEAACDLLYRRGVAGATVLSGIDGTVHGRRQHAQFLRRDADTPLMIIAVGASTRLAMVLPELGGLFRHPVMTVRKVSLCKRNGQLISRPPLSALPAPPAPPADRDPGPVAQAGADTLLRLTVYASEAARHEDQPLHRAIAGQLRAAGIGVAITLRGGWGFHDDRAPHGDRFARHGRHLPVITTVIGPPEQIGAAFGIIDALTPGHGLVTAEQVQTLRRPAAVRHDHGA